MGRVRGVVVAGAVAVVVSVVVAGPAVAAKGGNSDNAHACQQGGHENRFEAETGNPFKNAGDCVSHAAQGGATSSLQVLTDTYPCGGSSGTCWGTVSGSGLLGPYFVTNVDNEEPFFSGNANGTLSQKLELMCSARPGILSVEAFAKTTAGATIHSPIADRPTPCG